MHDGPGPVAERGDDRVGVQRGVHGVAGLGVGGGEAEVLGGGQAVAGASETDPRPGGGAQRVPRIDIAHPISARIGSGTSCGTRPASSSSPTDPSHASNSGAGRSPRVWRTCSTSWNDSDW